MNDQDRPQSQGVLLDDDPEPAPLALSYLVERPVFKVDRDSHLEFAVLDDLDRRAVVKASDRRPQALTEADSEHAHLRS